MDKVELVAQASENYQKLKRVKGFLQPDSDYRFNVGAIEMPSKYCLEFIEFTEKFIDEKIEQERKKILDIS
jgi:uncharacterized protein YqiB (DUF1249 family)